jgi:hypothetical protein
LPPGTEKFAGFVASFSNSALLNWLEENADEWLIFNDGHWNFQWPSFFSLRAANIHFVPLADSVGSTGWHSLVPGICEVV